MSRISRLLQNPQDLRYAFDKGAAALIRGVIWQITHLRKPNGFFLGAGVKFICANNLKLGRGVSIGARSYIETSASEPVIFGNGVSLRENTWIQCRSGFNGRGEGLVLEDRVYIGPNSVIGVGGKISIGEGCQIGAGVSLAAEQHEAHDGNYTTGKTRRDGITIGPGCWFGNNVTVLDGVEIGANSVIGAGSTVTRSLPAGCVAVGTPARVLRMVQPTATVLS